MTARSSAPCAGMRPSHDRADRAIPMTALGAGAPLVHQAGHPPVDRLARGE